MKRASSGDEAAVAAVFELVRPRIEFAVVAKMGRRLAARIDVEDVLQETFSAATQSLANFEVRDEPSCWAWWRTLALNQIRKAAAHWSAKRRDQERVAALTRSLTAAGTTPSQAFGRREEHERALLAMRSLSDDEREILWLTVVEELSPTEAAELIDISPQNARVRKHRALESLRTAFATLGGWEDAA